MVALVQRVAIVVDHLLRVLLGEYLLVDQTLGVQRAAGRVRLDLLVHQRLRGGRLVRLVVTGTTVADQVDHHVLLELHAVVHRQLGDEVDRLRIVRVDVEDRRLNHLRHVGAVFGGAGVVTAAGGEADLVVDDHVQGAAGLEAAGLGHLEGLHDHALTGERRVTMNQNRHHLVPAGVVAAILPGAHRPLHHRRHDLQVGRVEGQRQMHFAAGGLHVGREALVVLHVAGTVFVEALALELAEQIAGALAEDIDQQIQAATVGHADHHLLGAVTADPLDHLVHQRNHRFAAFQAETLGAGVTAAQVFFQAFGGGQTLENMALDVGAVLRVAAHALQPLLKPALLGGVDDVHVLTAHRGAIGALQAVHDLAQGGFRLTDEQVAGLEHRVHVRLAQAVVRQLQVGDRLALHQTERVQLGHLMAPVAVRGDQMKHPHLAAFMLAADGAGADFLHTGLVLGFEQEILTDRRMGDIGLNGAVGGQLFEVGAPVFRHGIGISQIGFVQFINIGRIGAPDMGGLPLTVHGTVLHRRSFLSRANVTPVGMYSALSTGLRPCYPRSSLFTDRHLLSSGPLAVWRLRGCRNRHLV